MTVDRIIKQGNLIPTLSARLAFADPAESLSNFIGLSTAVTFTMRFRGGTKTITDQPATVTAAGAGWVDVEYVWQAGDTDETGLFFAEFQFTVDGKTLDAPTNGFISIRVIPGL